jgi:hypothetical protein
MDTQETSPEISEVLTPAPAPEPERPVFLFVLCILTWVGSGLSLLVGSVMLLFVTLMTPALVDKHEQIQYERLSEVRHYSMDNLKDWVSTPGVLIVFALLILASAGLTLFGGLRMYRLRRSGYYAYILGQLINICLPLFLFGATSLGAMQCIFPFVFGMAFIVMYGVNYKYMVAE